MNLSAEEVELEKLKLKMWTPLHKIALLFVILAILQILFCGLSVYLVFDHINKAIYEEHKIYVESQADDCSSIIMNDVANIRR